MAPARWGTSAPKTDLQRFDQPEVNAAPRDELLRIRSAVSERGGTVLTFSVCFSGNGSQVKWTGKHVEDVSAFTSYLTGVVQGRLIDEVHQEEFETDLQALATTQMQSATLIKLLAAGKDIDREPWEVGEALAECVLADEYGVKWPWNTERDKRTPRASLPGADLVGFIEQGADAFLVLGEVKTSADKDTPPNVMTGGSGMIHQLESLVSDIHIHHCLLQWLHKRCKGTELWSIFQKATQRYLQSEGKALVVFGLLMRDTSPHELDLKNRAAAIGKSVSDPTRIELSAWYLPKPVTDWPMLAKGTGS